MALNIEIKRSNVPGKIPTTSSLELGQLALNTYDGKAYMKKKDGGGESVVEIGSGSMALTASYAISASYALNATSASYALTSSFSFNTISASYAATASSADNFIVRGTLTAQTIVAQTITSSTDFVTGSTIFGSLLSNTHQFTGSVSITGSLTVANGVNNLTASNAVTASYAVNATSASYALNSTSASYALNSTSASYALNATSASYALNSTSASYALNTTSASYAINATSASFATTTANILGGAQNYIPFFNTNTTLSSSVLYQNSGNIGIGTTTPGARLEIYSATGSAGFNNGISILTQPGTFTTGHGGILQFQNEDVITAGLRGIREAGGWEGSLLFYTHTTGAGNTFNSTFTEKMRIASNGNVGIGTTSPTDKLTINGNLFLTGSNRSIWIGNNADSEPRLRIFHTGTDAYLDYSSSLYIRNGDPNVIAAFDPSGNVGINTMSPTAKLHVAGTIVSKLGSTDGYISLQPGNSSVQGYIEWYKPGSGPIRVGYMGYNDGSTANNLAITLENSADLIVNGGDVGIGTITPSDKLTVNGNLFLTGSARSVWIGNNADSRPRFRMHHNGTDAYLDYSSSLYIRNGVPGIITTFDPSGNVGIGTTNPGYLLDVAGNVRLGNVTRPVVYDGGGGNFRITPNSGGWATGYFFNGSSGTYRGGFGGYGGADALTYYWIGADYNSATLHITSGSASSGASVGINDTTFASKLTISNDDGGADGNIFQRWKYVPTSNAYYLDLKQTVTSGVVRYNFSMVNNSTTYNNVLVLDRGNVGIGTTDPAYKLDVSGDIRGTGSLYISTGNATGGGIVLADDGDIVDLNDAYATHRFSYGLRITNANKGGSTVIQLGNGAVGAGPTYFNSGNVGIGITSPSQKLEVSGSALIGPGSGKMFIGDVGHGTTYPAIAHQDYATTTGYALLAPSDGYLFLNKRDVASTYIGFRKNNADLMVINNDGKVVIGGTTSSYKLHVVGAGSLLALGEESFSTGKQLLVGVDGSGNAEIQAVHQGTAYRNIYMNPNGGDVGIGTTSPGAKLEVNGAIKTSNPNTGTAQPWKLGSVVATSVVLDENNYVEVDINGTLYKLALVSPA